MKISIIIPAYNVEKYIESCLASLVKQDLPESEYEIIVVNDGSTDSTYSKIVDFAKDYSNFIIIDKINENVGIARNTGLDRASGEYILFIDSDDTIVENSLNSIYTQMKDDDLDILEFDFICENENREKIITNLYPEKEYRRPLNRIMNGRDNLLYSNLFIPMAATRGYRREFLLEHNLYMISCLHEDENFTPRAFYFAKRVKYSGMSIYKYLIRKGSITNSYNRKNIFDTVISMGLLKKFVDDNISKDDVEMRQYITRRIIDIMRMVYIRSYAYGYEIQKEFVIEMKKSKFYPFNPDKKRKYKIIFDFSTFLFIKYYNRKLKNRKLMQ